MKGKIDWWDIGIRLRDLRVEKKLTQKELADRCNCSYKYISEIERGIATPSMEFLFTLIQELDKPFDYLFQDQLLVSANYLKITFLYDKLRKLNPKFLDVAVFFIEALVDLQQSYENKETSEKTKDRNTKK